MIWNTQNVDTSIKTCFIRKMKIMFQFDLNKLWKMKIRSSAWNRFPAWKVCCVFQFQTGYLNTVCNRCIQCLIWFTTAEPQIIHFDVLRVSRKPASTSNLLSKKVPLVAPLKSPLVCAVSHVVAVLVNAEFVVFVACQLQHITLICANALTLN